MKSSSQLDLINYNEESSSINDCTNIDNEFKSDSSNTTDKENNTKSSKILNTLSNAFILFCIPIIIKILNYIFLSSYYNTLEVPINYIDTNSYALLIENLPYFFFILIETCSVYTTYLILKKFYSPLFNNKLKKYSFLYKLVYILISILTIFIFLFMNVKILPIIFNQINLSFSIDYTIIKTFLWYLLLYLFPFLLLVILLVSYKWLRSHLLEKSGYQLHTLIDRYNQHIKKRNSICERRDSIENEKLTLKEELKSLKEKSMKQKNKSVMEDYSKKVINIGNKAEKLTQEIEQLSLIVDEIDTAASLENKNILIISAYHESISKVDSVISAAKELFHDMSNLSMFILIFLLSIGITFFLGYYSAKNIDHICTTTYSNQDYVIVSVNKNTYVAATIKQIDTNKNGNPIIHYENTFTLLNDETNTFVITYQRIDKLICE